MNFGNKLTTIFVITLLTGVNLLVPASATDSSGTGAKVAVDVFGAPQEISLETDLGYKVKSGEYSQYKDDFDNLGRALQKALVLELQDRLGNNAVVALAPNRESSNPPKSDYVVEGRINKIRFEGNTLIPNYYELTLTAKMRSTKTGEIVWQLHHKMFAHMYHTRSEGAASVFNERMTAHVASKVANSIASAAE